MSQIFPSDSIIRHSEVTSFAIRPRPLQTARLEFVTDIMQHTFLDSHHELFQETDIIMQIKYLLCLLKQYVKAIALEWHQFELLTFIGKKDFEGAVTYCLFRSTKCKYFGTIPKET